MGIGNFRHKTPALILLSGLPGSGKTTFAHRLAAVLPLRHVESDAIRHGIASPPTYAREESALVFARAEDLVRAALQAGSHALLDATNVSRSDRQRFVQLADRLGAPLILVRMVVPRDEIRRRLAMPRTGFSEAAFEVAERMSSRAEPFERPVVVVDTRFDPGPSVSLVLRLVGENQRQ